MWNGSCVDSSVARTFNMLRPWHSSIRSARHIHASPLETSRSCRSLCVQPNLLKRETSLLRSNHSPTANTHIRPSRQRGHPASTSPLEPTPIGKAVDVSRLRRGHSPRRPGRVSIYTRCIMQVLWNVHGGVDPERSMRSAQHVSIVRPQSAGREGWTVDAFWAPDVFERIADRSVCCYADKSL
jgi:hypothetical protein